MFTNLQNYVLHVFFIVVCIINITDTAKLFMIFRLNVIFVNKVMKIIESNVIIILTHYAFTLVVMIEDHKQLKLTVLSQKDLNQ